MTSPSRITYFALVFVVLGEICSVYGHGLTSSPASRGWFCGYITQPSEILYGTPEYPQCGDAFYATGLDVDQAYNYMSMNTHTLGYAVNGSRANVCSYNSEFFYNLDGYYGTWTDQPIDWPLNTMTSGPQWFIYNITWGPHFSDTFEFSFWITNPDFVYTIGTPLSFTDFGLTPFCNQSYTDADNTANPNVIPNYTLSSFQVMCDVPERSGHHVIYAEWGRLPPTYERFHECIDGMFGGGTSPTTTTGPTTTTTTTTTVTAKSSSTGTTKTSTGTTKTSTGTAKTSTGTTKTATTTTTTSSSATPTSTAACGAKYSQCGGTGWAGATCCTASTCTVSNAYYSQCL